ncbi:MAG: HAD-IA family hydrolase [Proteobacteria bacterium]|nr:HAD-IA family hydrolase [Pseudomonadota bacterium]
MNARVRAVAFDLDNTLWDVEPVLARAEDALHGWLRQHCPRIAARLSPAELQLQRARLAHSEPHNAHDMTYLRVAVLTAQARLHGYPDEVAQQAFGVFLAARSQVSLFGDVLPAFGRLRRRYALASLTNGNADLEAIGITGEFTVSLDARGVGAAKPQALCFERLAGALGCTPGEVLYVGDDPQLDVAGARAAGMGTVWINRRAHTWPAHLQPADLVVRDCLELADALGA